MIYEMKTNNQQLREELGNLCTCIDEIFDSREGEEKYEKDEGRGVETKDESRSKEHGETY